MCIAHVIALDTFDRKNILRSLNKALHLTEISVRVMKDVHM
jgi:hypothetical protein